MRVYALLAIVSFLSLYAFRNWFVSACALVVLLGVVQHPDFPNSMGGIQGANPWNVLLLCVVIAWQMGRRREGLRWDLPRGVMICAALYGLAVLISFVRMMLDGGQAGLTTSYLISEYIINAYKWVVPGIILFDGCRTRARFHGALGSIVALYVLLGIQVIKWMPPSAAVSGIEMNKRALKILLNEIGYHPVNLSMLLAGASWGTLALVPLLKRTWHRYAVVVIALGIAYGQALTGGRMGYATWGVVGLVMGMLRWRKYLIVLPIIVGGVMLFLPGVTERMLRGFGMTDATGDTVTNEYEVTSGRNLAWPYVIDKIGESPGIGFGRDAMIRTGISRRLQAELNEEFPHPHNAYLECLLDNGIVGLAMIMPFYIIVLVHSIRLLLARGSPYYSAVGGMCSALVLALLVAAIGSQTFYPREGSVGMWAAIGLMLRMSLMRQAALRRQAVAARPGQIWTAPEPGVAAAPAS